MPDVDSSIRRTLCFFSDPSGGEQPSYIAQTSDIPGKGNYEHNRVVVTIRDIRCREAEFSLRTHSFAALPGEFRGRHVDFEDNNEVSTQYILYIEELLLNKIPGATGKPPYPKLRYVRSGKYISTSPRKGH